MRAAIMRGGRLVVDEITDPEPREGQLLVGTRACGICGSDLHALAHGPEFVSLTRELIDSDPTSPLKPEVMDLSLDVVMGHEFCAEVLECGPGTTRRPGELVVSVPFAFDAGGMHQVGYDNVYPGGYGELMVLNDLLALPVPNGLQPEWAALTEPMAVGEHAAALSGIGPRDAAVVFGCGPVGLAVVAALARRQVEVIVAADFSPARRALALRMGAVEAVDPRTEPALAAWRRIDPSAATRSIVLFEAVGVPGMIDEAMTAAPRRSRIVVVGVCMQPDTIRPLMGVGKELSMQFAFGYEPDEFAATLHAIAEGELAVEPLITGRVGIEGVPGAFEALADPEAHAKILVLPP